MYRRHLLYGFAELPSGLMAPAPRRSMLTPAESREVDLLLVLAADVSASISPKNARLQREGYGGAIRDSKVMAAVRSGVNGAIGLAYVEWAGIWETWSVLPWARIGSQAAADGWASRLGEAPLRRGSLTSISAGIEFSRRLLASAPWNAPRRVIDVSGDGVNNAGPPVEQARDRALSDGITINGLPVIDDEQAAASESGLLPAEAQCSKSADWADVSVQDYYRACVIGGTDAFLSVAEDFASFAQAIRRKLIREIAGALGAVLVVVWHHNS
jgi:Protein of unknown function (DUF1194)